MKFEPKLYHLSNGIPVILDNMDIASTRVSITFETGSRDEKPDEYGITHFCEHMLCKGTNRFPEQKQRLDFLQNNGGISSAGTSVKSLNFSGRIISENLSVLIDVLADQINDSLFDEKKIEIERGAILDEFYTSLDKPSRQRASFWLKTLFDWYVPNGLLTIGNPENIKSFTRNQLLDFYHSRISARNCRIVISGKINDNDAIINQLDKLFSKLPTHDVSQNREIHYNPSIAHNFMPNNSNIFLEIVFPEIWPDIYENRFKNKCVSKFELFAKQELQQTIRRENGLVYAIENVSDGNEKFSVNGFGTTASPENIGRVVALMAKTLHKLMTTNPITNEDLQRFSNIAKLADADFLENSGSRSSILGSFYHRFDKLYDFYESRKMSESITADDVIQNTREYFSGPMSIITQGAEFKDDLRQIWIDNFK